MRFPDRLHTRTGFILIFVLMALLYGLAMVMSGVWLGKDGVNGIIGAVIGAVLSALIVWPRRNRTAGRMTILGIILAALIVWFAFTAIGFLSEREITSRAGAGGNSVLSFIGSLIMGALLGLFSVLKQLGLPLGLGAAVGFLFRQKISETDPS